MADLGEDFAGVSDIDLNLSLVSGRLAYAQAIACRVFEEPGGLFYEATYGAGARDLIGRSGIPTNSSLIEDQIRQDERTETVDVEIAFNEATSELQLLITLDDGDGPFGLVLTPRDLSLEVKDEEL